MTAFLSASAAVASLPEGEAELLTAVLVELQGRVNTLMAGVLPASAIKAKVIAGGATTTNLPVTGLGASDTLISVVQFNKVADTGTSATGNKIDDVADLTSEAAVTSAGNIQLTTTTTTGDKLLVVWAAAP